MFKNDGRGGGQVLPKKTTYREYDVNRYIKGQNRGGERVVIGKDGSAWYTNDHYKTFTRIK
ncbi:ribonuclease domain-containing protein [Serpentinicella sp. ANB-PHB4]|uniref:ribonuclease domain-containing protein n=1 Tax=Serpentinicella sp. ANB-PHB4 TaxID=3074076 RepID=UPI003FA70BB4